MSVSQMNGDYYPSNLKFIANSLSGFSRMRSKLTLPFASAKGGDTIFFKLPSNAMIDLSTLSFHFDFTSTTTTGTIALPPQYTSCLIDQLSIDLNGINAQTIPSYAHLYKMLSNYMAGDQMNRNSFLEFVGLTNQVPTAGLMTNTSLAIKQWLGILGSGKIIDTSVLGEITVSMRLIPNNALVAPAATGHSYTLSNMSVQFDTINLDNPVYHESLYRQLSNGGLKWAFTNYITNIGGASSFPVSQTFSVSTQSLDYLLGTLLQSDFNGSAGIAHQIQSGSSYYFLHGQKGTPSATENISNAQYQIGSVLLPNYRPNIAEQLSYTLDSLGLNSDVLGRSAETFRAATDTAYNTKYNTAITANITNYNLYQNYSQGNYCFAARLCHGEKNPGVPLMSGLSTQGTNTMINFRVEGATASTTYIPIVFAVCTSLLTIGQGRQINLTI